MSTSTPELLQAPTPPKLCSQIQTVSLIFQRTAHQIHQSQLGSLEYFGGTGSGWHERLWLALCGTSQTCHAQDTSGEKKKRKKLADYKAERTQRSGYVANALSLQSKIVDIATERPPTWEECDRIAELFVYGVLVWSHRARSNLDRLVLLSRTRDLLFHDYIASDSAQESLEAAASRYTCVKSLLAEAAHHESYFHVSTSFVTPISRRVYKEQDELARLVQHWWDQKKSHLLFYEAPPSSGKTTSVAFVATLLYVTRVAFEQSGAGAYILYACHVSQVRQHLRLHLEACSVPFAHIYAQHTEDSHFNLCVALGTPVVSNITPEKLVSIIDRWTLLPGDQRPLVLVCDLPCAKLVSRRRPNDLMFLDEVCTSAFSHSECRQLIQDAPQFLVLLSSFMPLPHQVREYVDIHEKKWPDFSLSHIRSRRPQPSVTAFLSDGSVAMPHHFGVSYLTIRHFPHLMRFYSATALKTMLEEETLDAAVILDCEDLSSTKRVRRKCLELIEDGITRTRRRVATSSGDDQAWQSFIWDEVFAFKEQRVRPFTLIYTEDPWKCLQLGRQVWKQAADVAEPLIFQDHSSENIAIIASAMRKGVAILSNEEKGVPLGIDAEYNAWVHLNALRGKLVCVLANFSVLHGVHLPFSRVFFWTAPSSFEASTHICGRVGRKSCDCNFTIHCKDEAAAAIAMIPDERPA